MEGVWDKYFAAKWFDLTSSVTPPPPLDLASAMRDVLPDAIEAPRDLIITPAMWRSYEAMDLATLRCLLKTDNQHVRYAVGTTFHKKLQALCADEDPDAKDWGREADAAARLNDTPLLRFLINWMGNYRNEPDGEWSDMYVFLADEVRLDHSNKWLKLPFPKVQEMVRNWCRGDICPACGVHDQKEAPCGCASAQGH